MQCILTDILNSFGIQTEMKQTGEFSSYAFQFLDHRNQKLGYIGKQLETDVSCLDLKCIHLLT